MKKLTSTLFAAALMLSPATISAQTDTADTEKKAAEKADQEVVLEANDQMQFNKKAFEIKAGNTVKLTLKHVGKLPKISELGDWSAGFVKNREPKSFWQRVLMLKVKRRQIICMRCLKVRDAE